MKSPTSVNTKLQPPAIQELAELLAHEMLQVDRTIGEATKSDIPLIAKITQHLIQAGGKRIRPLLALAANKLLGPFHQHAIYLSAAVEFIHTATLLHDDVVDESPLRREKPAANRIWGNSASILVGDFLFARAFELMVRCHNLSVLEILSTASAKIAEGEVLQLQYCQDFSITEEVSMKIIGSKTAELFAASCQSGATIINASQDYQRALRAYGFSLGLIFQVTDDILDYTSSNRGKTIGDDFREGKITLPLILGYQNSSHKERTFLRELITSKTLSQDDLLTTRKIIENNHGFEKSYQLAQGFYEQALAALACLPQNRITTLLGHIALECLTRER